MEQEPSLKTYQTRDFIQSISTIASLRSLVSIYLTKIKWIKILTVFFKIYSQD